MWTTYEDISDRWIGGPVPADEAVVVTLIGDAEDTILREFSDVQDRIDDGSLPEARVVKVAARMVIRHLRNPTGQRSTQHGAGPFQQSVTYGGDEPGAMYLTAEDRYELAGPVNKHAAVGHDMTPAWSTTAPDPWVRVV